MTKQTIALISIARPTFDVPLAQSVADTALQQLTNAGFSVVGTRNELLMDAAAAELRAFVDADQPRVVLRGRLRDHRQAGLPRRLVQLDHHRAVDEDVRMRRHRIDQHLHRE